jgi:hypothetical protein
MPPGASGRAGESNTKRAERRERRATGRAIPGVRFPEAIVRGDLGHGGRRRIGHSQRSAGQMHSAKPQISPRAHAQILLTAGAEGAVRCSRGRAEFRHIQGAIRVRVQHLFQPPHDPCVAVMGPSGGTTLSAADARNHRVLKALLKRPSYLGMGQDAWGRLGEVAGRFLTLLGAALASADTFEARLSLPLTGQDRYSRESGAQKIRAASPLGTKTRRHAGARRDDGDPRRARKHHRWRPPYAQKWPWRRLCSMLRKRATLEQPRLSLWRRRRRHIGARRVTGKKADNGTETGNRLPAGGNQIRTRGPVSGGEPARTNELSSHHNCGGRSELSPNLMRDERLQFLPQHRRDPG